MYVRTVTMPSSTDGTKNIYYKKKGSADEYYLRLNKKEIQILFSHLFSFIDEETTAQCARSLSFPRASILINEEKEKIHVDGGEGKKHVFTYAEASRILRDYLHP